MANKIVIKHRTGTSGEPTLSVGEIATNILDKQIFIGTGAGNVVFPDLTYVDTAVSNLVASAPGTLDTLNELANALGNDANFATTVTDSLAAKAPKLDAVLTGTPTVPLAAAGSNTAQIASTAFVQNEISSLSVSGSTNLSVVGSTTDVTVTSDTGTDAVISSASTTTAGVLSSSDKAKLDGVEAGANAYVLPSSVLNTASVIDGGTF